MDVADFDMTKKDIFPLSHLFVGLLLGVLVANARGQQYYYGGQGKSYDENSPRDNCLFLRGNATTNQTQVPCEYTMRAGAGAIASVGIVALLWIVAGLYAVLYHPVSIDDGECSESGYTEASTVDNDESIREPRQLDVTCH